MRLVRCDRCGVEVIDSGHDVVLLGKQHAGVNRIKDTFDICPGCRDNIAAFIEAKK